MNTDGLQHVGGGIWVPQTPTAEERHAAAMEGLNPDQLGDQDAEATDLGDQSEDAQDQPQQFIRKVRGIAAESTGKPDLPNAANSQPSLDERPQGDLPVKEKVQLTAKINRDLHARMRIMSFHTHKSMSELIEDFIRQCCPE